MKHVAIDLGGRESQICVRAPNNEILEEGRLGTRKLAAFFDKLEKPSRVILETTAEAFAVADQALAAGHDVRVVAATLVRALGVGQRGIKTDVRDARCLSEASVRMDLGSVHIPSHLAREMKTSCAMRATLVRSRTSLINSVRGWQRCNLMRMPGGAAETFPVRVRTHLAKSKIEVPPYVDRQLNVIDAMTTQLRAADDELKELADNSDDARRLMTIPGVGPTVAVTFLASVDRIDRFKKPHELESYFGLTPGEQSSSDSKHRTGLTKAGSPAVRSLMIQAAWSALRCRPNDPMVLWASKIIQRTGKKNVAVVALARKIVGIMFAMMRDKTDYQPQRASTARPEAREPTAIPDAVDVLRLAREETDEIDTSGARNSAPFALATDKELAGSSKTRASTKSTNPSKRVPGAAPTSPRPPRLGRTDVAAAKRGPQAEKTSMTD